MSNLICRVTGVSKILFAIILLTGAGLPTLVNAQDLEPRRWSHLPIGMNIVGAGYAYPIGKSQSVKLVWLSGHTQNLVGRDSDNLLLSWSMRWAN